MGKIFSGFKDKMLVGKEDLIQATVTKIPQANDVVYSFNQQPSLSAVSTETIVGTDAFQRLLDIQTNSTSVKLDQGKYSIQNNKNTVYPSGLSFGEEGPIAIP